MSRYVYLLTDRVEILSLTENLKFKLFPRSKLEVIKTLLNNSYSTPILIHAAQ